MDKDFMDQITSILQGIEAGMFYNVLSDGGSHEITAEYLKTPIGQAKLNMLKMFGSDLAVYISQLVEDGEFQDGKEQKEEN